MSEFYPIKDLPSDLIPLYLTEESFWNRFYKASRIEDPFARVYDVCDDIFHNNTRVAVKDYSSSSQQQCQNVLENLKFYLSIQKIEELCRLVAFCQEDSTGDIKAAFQYRDEPLEQVIERLQFKHNSHDFYLLILRQLFTSIISFKSIGITLEDLVLTNILLYNSKGSLKLKILFDQREKKYDKIQQGLKTYSSPVKINTALSQKQEAYNQNGQEIIFELGLLLLDIVHLYESAAVINMESTNTHSSRPLGTSSSSTLFKSYLTFEHYSLCKLNTSLIQSKMEYLSNLNSMFINQLLSLITKMVGEVPQRINLGQLETEIKMLAEIKSREEKDYQLELVPFRNVEQEISPIKSKDEEYRVEDSLKYSDSRQEVHAKKMIQSQSTVPTSHNHLVDIKPSNELAKNDGQPQFCIIPKQKLLSISCHSSMKKKLEMFIIQLQNKVTLDRKSYYDGNIYYGEIDKLTQKREGLGIYAYHFGDVYFGLWKDNLILEGMYIFRNGDSFEGVVRKGKQGKGTYIYDNGNVYEGAWVDDRKHGAGKMFYSNGDSYDGQWNQGKRNGQGTYFFHNGIIYKGSFLSGKKHGFGVIDFGDGTKIEAHWLANHIEGKGKIHYTNGDYFEGVFNVSLKQGSGLYCWEDSIKYQGNFKKDLMEGFAKINYDNNEYFQGHIFEGKRQGQGYYKYSNGDYFKGEWKNDEKHSGEYHYRNGDIFEGKFTVGEISYGVMIYPNGQSYEGEFQDGLRHGLGVYRQAAGQILFQGQWSRDNYMD